MDGQMEVCGKYTNFLPDCQAAITPPNTTCKHRDFYILYKKAITQFQWRDRISEVKESLRLDQMPRIRDQAFEHISQR